MWSKGAVVVVKHGDQDWADSMEQAVKDIQMILFRIYQELICFYLYDFLKKH